MGKKPVSDLAEKLRSFGSNFSLAYDSTAPNYQKWQVLLTEGGTAGVGHVGAGPSIRLALINAIEFLNNRKIMQMGLLSNKINEDADIPEVDMKATFIDENFTI